MKNQGICAIRVTGVLASMASALVMAGPATAGVVILGDSGWQASWDSSLDSTVDVDFLRVVGNTIFIQKAAEFTLGPTNGVFSSVPITFQQIGASTITHISMDDEIITNSTGVSWTGFKMKLLDHGQATFDQQATLDSGGPGPIGFAIAPFTTASYNEDNTKLIVSGGVITPGQIWNPGTGANDGGQLWMNVVSGDEGNFTTFTLKERPTSEVVPGPSTLLALAGLVGFIGRRRRQNA